MVVQGLSRWAARPSRGVLPVVYAYVGEQGGSEVQATNSHLAAAHCYSVEARLKVPMQLERAIG